MELRDLFGRAGVEGSHALSTTANGGLFAADAWLVFAVAVPLPLAGWVWQAEVTARREASVGA